jgi:hypothetical protein
MPNDSAKSKAVQLLESIGGEIVEPPQTIWSKN